MHCCCSTQLQLLLVLLLLLLLFQAAAAAAAAANSPVVLVPGDGGTQLWAKLNNTHNHWYCERTTSSTLIWLNIPDLVYPAVNCLVYNLILKFNKKTGTTTDNDQVKVDIKGFGDTETVEWLSNIKLPPTAYFHKVVEFLVNSHGYRRGVDIHGAPFDFRKAPNELTDYYKQLKALIETTYSRNGARKVTLVGHSLGCKVVLHFLHTMPQAWKAKYVKNFVAAAGPFGGAASSLVAAVAGYNLGLSFIKPIWVRESQRSWPSTYYLTPSSLAFNETWPIVSRPSRNYTLNPKDLKRLFDDAGSVNGFALYQKVGNVTRQTLPPGVPTTCVFGYNVKTPRQFKWHREGDFPDKQPETVYGDGDGTVNIASLDVCLDWQKKHPAAVTSVLVQNADHLKILERDEFVQAVTKAALAP